MRRASKTDSYRSSNPEETSGYARKLASSAKSGDVFLFYGDLGAGKTTFIKSFIAEIAGVREEDVQSPTFIYLNIYEGPFPVYHFDLYRLKDRFAFEEAGFGEYLMGDGVACLEWSERLGAVDFPHTAIRMEHLGEDHRLIEVVRREL